MARATTRAPRGAQGGKQVACGTAWNVARHGRGQDCLPRAGRVWHRSHAVERAARREPSAAPARRAGLGAARACGIARATFVVVNVGLHMADWAGRARRPRPRPCTPNAGASVARATAECGTAVRARARIRRIGARPS
eukprot:2172553-Pleurochrysis_carterae.AAC.1